MKNLKKLIGVMGEEAACKFLKNIGYKIIDRNYISRHGEIDIVALQNRTIVFVEVKTRKDDNDLYACQSVTPKKMRNIRLTSNQFLSSNNLYNYDYRFDIIECYWRTKKINHIVDAF